MSITVGFDTSNYTTSAAVLDTSDMSVRNVKRLLPVKDGERGLRQSDAVFLHTKALPEIMEEAFEGIAASVVDIPESCVSIGAHAFRNCPNLTQIRIPDGCTLGTDVFDGCAMVFVFGTPSSGAEAYCSTHANCEFVPLE